MVTQGLLSDADLKARLKGLTSEQKQVVLKDRNYIPVRGSLSAGQLKDLQKQSEFETPPRTEQVSALSICIGRHWKICYDVFGEGLQGRTVKVDVHLTAEKKHPRGRQSCKKSLSGSIALLATWLANVNSVASRLNCFHPPKPTVPSPTVCCGPRFMYRVKSPIPTILLIGSSFL